MRLLLTLCAVVALVACQRTADPASTGATDQAMHGGADEAEEASGDAPAAAAQAEPTPAEAPATDALHAIDLASLRANHDVDGEGDGCGVDDDCDSPLRCIERECHFPPAMTGEVDDTTPVAVFHPSAGGTHTYYLELALSRNEQMRGLMHRRTMAPDFGMLFVFPREAPRSFWMHNTLISLDIVYLDRFGTVVSVAERARPLDDTSLPSAGPARYVIELVGGSADEMGLEPGDRVELSNLSQELRPATHE